MAALGSWPARPTARRWWSPPTTIPTASTRPTPTPPRAGRCWSTPARACWPTGAPAGRPAARWCRPWPSRCRRSATAARHLEFTLRDDARFGPPANRPVRPSDVKASIERLFLVPSPGRALFRVIRGTSAFERTGTGGIAGIVARDSTGDAGDRPDPLRAGHPRRAGPALRLRRCRAAPRPATRARRRWPPRAPTASPSYAPGQAIDLVRNAGYAPGDGRAERPRPRPHPRGHRRQPRAHRRRGHRLQPGPARARPRSARRPSTARACRATPTGRRTTSS